MDLRNLSNDELLNKADSIDREEKNLVALMLHHLREIETRRLFSSLGYKSLFEFTMKRFNYSEDQAMRRISAMRLLKELPEVESKINDGALTLSNLGKAQSFFQKEKKLGLQLSNNEKLQVLETLENKSAREADKIILSRSSAPATLIHERVRQVTPELSEIKFAADEKLLQKIEKIKGLLAHSNPNISMMELLHKLCDLGIEKWDLGAKKNDRGINRLDQGIIVVDKEIKKLDHRIKKSNAARPATSQKQCVTKIINKRDYIPMATQREVWRKAKSCCEICSSTYALEIDHIRPISLKGGNEIDNLRLLCRSCNQRSAIEKLGTRQMQNFI